MAPTQETGSRSLVLAVAVLVLMAGCMSTVGDSAKDALGVEDPAEADGDDTGDGGSETLSSGGSAATYESAFEALDEDEEIQRWNMSVRTENASGTMAVDLLVDAETPLFAASVESTTGNGLLDEQAEERMIIAQVGKTTLFGSPKGVFGFYNESADPPHESLEGDAGQGASQAPTVGSGNVSGPAAILESFEDLPEDVVVEREEATVRGEPGYRVHAEGDDGTLEANLTVLLLEDPLRPASMEGTMRNATPGSEFQQPTRVDATFHYGEAAEHPDERALVRAESMAIASQSESTSLGDAEDGNRTTRTIQPSINPGLLPLSEVQILAGPSNGPSSAEGSTEEPALTLDPENGSVENEDARLAYDDVDGDGHVSPGDEIRLVAKNENGTDYTVGLKDEETGMRMAPGPGAALFAALAGVAVLARARRA